MAVLSARHLQDLADSRAAEALALLQLGHFSGAYYLAGYALECGLKALIASEFEAGVIPDKKLVQQIHTHKLIELLKLAGIDGEVHDENTAKRLISAICDPEHGVFQWIRSKW